MRYYFLPFWIHLEQRCLTNCLKAFSPPTSHSLKAYHFLASCQGPNFPYLPEYHLKGLLHTYNISRTLMQLAGGIIKRNVQEVLVHSIGQNYNPCLFFRFNMIRTMWTLNNFPFASSVSCYIPPHNSYFAGWWYPFSESQAWPLLELLPLSGPVQLLVSLCITCN